MNSNKTFLVVLLLGSSTLFAATKIAPKPTAPMQMAQKQMPQEKIAQKTIETKSLVPSLPGIVRIGDMAPSFTADSTQGKKSFPADFKGKWVIFFSHPADFTPVCTTEFKRLMGLEDEFNKMNATLVGISVDSAYTHEIWMRDLEKQETKEGKPKRTIRFPVFADTDKKIVTQYGMIHPNESKDQTVRSVFFIDPTGKVRAIFYYPMSNGRSFNEIKRLLTALQTTDEKNVATPADWEPGKKTIDKEKIKKDIMPE